MARNAAVAKTRGGWVLVIDADETFDLDGSLSGLLADVSDDIAGFRVTLHAGKEYRPVRLFRTDRGIEFTGSIREQLAVDSGLIEDSDIVIRNTRTPGEESTDREISEIIDSGLGTLHQIFTMMEVSSRKGDIGEVLRYGEMFVQHASDSSLVFTPYRRAYNLLCAAYLEQGAREKALETAYRVLNENSSDGEMWYHLASVYAVEENYTRALLARQRFDALPGSSSHPRRQEFEELIRTVPAEHRDAVLPDGQDQTVSVCVVFRYDFDDLDTILENVSPFADEVIVGNGTELPASEVPAFEDDAVRIFDISRSYDRAASWNCLRDNARSEWVLCMEPGERISDDSVLLFRDLLRIQGAGQEALRTVCDELEHGVIRRRAGEVRLVRRESGYLFSGIAFPFIEGDVPFADISIINMVRTGNMPGFIKEIREKQQILELQDDDERETAAHYTQYARVFEEIGNWQLAVVNAQKGIAFCQADLQRFGIEYRYLLGLLVRGLLALDCVDEAATYADELILSDQDYIDGHFYSIVSRVYQANYDDTMELSLERYFQLRTRLFRGVYSLAVPVYSLSEYGGMLMLKGGLIHLKDGSGVDLFSRGLSETEGDLPRYVQEFLIENAEILFDTHEMLDALEEYTESVDCLRLLIHLDNLHDDRELKLRHLEQLGTVSSFYRGDASYYKAEIFIEHEQTQMALAHYVSAVNEYQRIINSGYRIPQDMLVRYAESLERTGRITSAIGAYEVLLKVCGKSEAEMIRIKIQQLKSIVEDK
jgi:tetratricopeptide (TPR) repeat protein